MKLSSYHGDMVAICSDCKQQHHIGKHDLVESRAWVDWLTKHRGHQTALVTRISLAQRLHEIWNSLQPLKWLRREEWRSFANNADIKEAYAASAAYTCTLTSLATDANLLTGREATGISNTTNKYLDELIAGLVTTGTSPTVSTQIEVHGIGALSDTPLYPDVFDGTDSAETITNAGNKSAYCKQLAIMIITATSSVGYYFGPTGLRQWFGGDGLPPAHTLFVTHNTAVNLHVTGANHALYHTPLYNTVI